MRQRSNHAQNGLFAVYGFALAITVSAGANAQIGGLTIAPTRVVMEERTRSETVTVVNGSNDEATYRIAFENRHVDEDGVITTITESSAGEMFADSFIRYAPRQITVPPGSSQTIRLLARAGADLADGEYRSHLLVQTIPDDVGNTIEQTLSEGELAVQVVPVYGVSIPVIYRNGELDLAVAPQSTTVERDPDTPDTADVAVYVQRTGGRSVLSSIAIFVGDREIGRVGGAIYTPYDGRRFRVPVQSADIEGVTDVTVRIYDQENDDVFLAEATLPLGE